MSEATTIYPFGAWVDLEESEETTLKPFGPWFEPEEEEEPTPGPQYERLIEPLIENAIERLIV